MLQWLSGRPLAEKILSDLKQQISASGFTPGLAAISVGHDPSSAVYLRLKEQACQKVGINFEKHYFESPAADNPAAPAEYARLKAKLLSLIAELNARPEINGILLQLPLPDGLDPNPLIATLDPRKDIDGFVPRNKQAISPLFRGAGELLRTVRPDLRGQSVLIVANSQIFADGAADYFQSLGCQTQIHLFKSGAALSQNENPAKNPAADIIFTAVGRPGCLAGLPLKPGVIILDAGSTIIGGKSHGDLDLKTAENPAIAYATPVPGGLGPLTVAMLLQNTWDLAQKQKLPD